MNTMKRNVENDASLLDAKCVTCLEIGDALRFQKSMVLYYMTEINHVAYIISSQY